MSRSGSPRTDKETSRAKSLRLRMEGRVVALRCNWGAMVLLACSCRGGDVEAVAGTGACRLWERESKHCWVSIVKRNGVVLAGGCRWCLMIIVLVIEL